MLPLYLGCDVKMASYQEQAEDDDTGSEASSAVHNGSVISTVPDRHGFLGGSQYTADP
jgi:hypothetical protein